MAEPRFPDGWNWDELSGHQGAWVLFRCGRYCGWVEPRHGLFVANWRRGPLDWPNPWGENPEHTFRNPYEAMAYAESKANHTDDADKPGQGIPLAEMYMLDRHRAFIDKTVSALEREVPRA